MNKKKLVVGIVYTLIMLLSSCDQPIQYITEYVEVEKEVEKEIEIVRNVDNIVQTETIIYVEKEIYVMPEEIIIDPIKEYDNYITTGNKVFGVTREGFEEIPMIQGLFKIDGIIYFSIDELFYSQDSGTVVAVDNLPEIPTNEHVEFSSGEYKIEDYLYNGGTLSKVFNGTSNVGYYMIDGACLRGDDLIYSAPIDTGTRLKGIYIWTVNGNPLRIMESGRIW